MRDTWNMNWQQLTKILDDAIRHLNDILKEAGPCKTDNHGFCREHLQDGCRYGYAADWLEEIQ